MSDQEGKNRRRRHRRNEGEEAERPEASEDPHVEENRAGARRRGRGRGDRSASRRRSPQEGNREGGSDDEQRKQHRRRRRRRHEEDDKRKEMTNPDIEDSRQDNNDHASEERARDITTRDERQRARAARRRARGTAGNDDEEAHDESAVAASRFSEDGESPIRKLLAEGNEGRERSATNWGEAGSDGSKSDLLEALSPRGMPEEVEEARNEDGDQYDDDDDVDEAKSLFDHTKIMAEWMVEDIRNHIMRIVVHRTDTLKPDRLISRPFVQISFVNEDTGELLEKFDTQRHAVSSNENTNRIIPLLTQPCPLSGNEDMQAVFEEFFLVNESFLYLLDPKIIIFFDVMEFVFRATHPRSKEGMVPICWGFLRPVGRGRGGTYFNNTGQRHRLQLYKYKKNFSLAGLFKGQLTQKVMSKRATVPNSYLSWRAGKLNSSWTPYVLGCTLHVSVDSVECPSELKTAKRPLFPLEQEVGLRSASDMIASGARPDIEEIEEEEVKVKKRMEKRARERIRKTGKRCKMPNKLLYQLPSGSRGCFALRFSNDGIYLAAACSVDDMFFLRVFSTADGEEVARFPIHHDIVYELNWSPDHRELISASSDETVKVWDFHEIMRKPANKRGVTSAVIIPAAMTLQHSCYVYTAVYHPTAVDPMLIVTGSYDSVIRIFRRDTGAMVREILGHESWINCLAFDVQGNRLMSGDGGGYIRVWGSRPEHPPEAPENYICQKTIFEQEAQEDAVNSIQVNPSNKRLMALYRDNRIRIYDMLRYGIDVRLSGMRCDDTPIKSIFSPDGRFVLSGSEDGKIYAWDERGSEIGLMIDPGYKGPLYQVDWNKQQHMIAVCSFGSPHDIKVYDYVTDTPEFRVPPSVISEEPIGLTGMSADESALMVEQFYKERQLRKKESVRQLLDRYVLEENIEELNARRRRRRLEELKRNKHKDWRERVGEDLMDDTTINETSCSSVLCESSLSRSPLKKGRHRFGDDAHTVTHSLSERDDTDNDASGYGDEAKQEAAKDVDLFVRALGSLRGMMMIRDHESRYIEIHQLSENVIDETGEYRHMETRSPALQNMLRELLRTAKGMSKKLDKFDDDGIEAYKADIAGVLKRALNYVEANFGDHVNCPMWVEDIGDLCTAIITPAQGRTDPSRRASQAAAANVGPEEHVETFLNLLSAMSLAMANPDDDSRASKLYELAMDIEPTGDPPRPYNDMNVSAPLMVEALVDIVAELRKISRAKRDGSVKEETMQPLRAACEKGRHMIRKAYKTLPHSQSRMIVERLRALPDDVLSADSDDIGNLYSSTMNAYSDILGSNNHSTRAEMLYNMAMDIGLHSSPVHSGYDAMAQNQPDLHDALKDFSEVARSLSKARRDGDVHGEEAARREVVKAAQSCVSALPNNVHVRAATRRFVDSLEGSVPSSPMSSARSSARRPLTLDAAVSESVVNEFIESSVRISSAVTKSDLEALEKAIEDISSYHEMNSASPQMIAGLRQLGDAARRLLSSRQQGHDDRDDILRVQSVCSDVRHSFRKNVPLSKDKVQMCADAIRRFADEVTKKPEDGMASIVASCLSEIAAVVRIEDNAEGDDLLNILREKINLTSAPIDYDMEVLSKEKPETHEALRNVLRLTGGENWRRSSGVRRGILTEAQSAAEPFMLSKQVFRALQDLSEALVDPVLKTFSATLHEALDFVKAGIESETISNFRILILAVSLKGSDKARMAPYSEMSRENPALADLLTRILQAIVDIVEAKWNQETAGDSVAGEDAKEAEKVHSATLLSLTQNADVMVAESPSCLRILEDVRDALARGGGRTRAASIMPGGGVSERLLTFGDFVADIGERLTISDDQSRSDSLLEMAKLIDEHDTDLHGSLLLLHDDLPQFYDILVDIAVSARKLSKVIKMNQPRKISKGRKELLDYGNQAISKVSRTLKRKARDADPQPIHERIEQFLASVESIK